VEEKFGDKYLVVNSSISGNTTRMALERIPDSVQKKGLVLMVLQLGMNDCNYWETDKGLPRVNPEAFRHNLLEIIDRARNFGARIVMLNTNHPSTRTVSFPYTGRSYEEGNLRYNRIIREVAQKGKETRLVDLELAFRQRMAQGVRLEDLLLADGLHLSLKGHDLYFETVKPLLFASLSAIDPELD
jgi:acyl-CoA thioesterase I